MCTHPYIHRQQVHTHIHTWAHIHTCAHIHTHVPSSLLPHPSSLSSPSFPWHTSLLPLCTQLHACLETGKLPTVKCTRMIALSGRWTTLLKILCSSHCFIVFVSLVDHWPLPYAGPLGGPLTLTLPWTTWWTTDPYLQSNIICCHFHCSSQDESGHAIGLWFQHDYTRREGLKNSNMEGGIQLWREGFNW